MMKKTPRMRMNLTLAAVMLLAGTLVGCDKPMSSGGGTRAVWSKTTTTEARYGIDGDRKLVFVIFTRYPTGKGKGSPGSSGSWSGTLEGPGVAYEADKKGILIDGTRFSFDSGRVFLVSSTKDGLSVAQLATPIGNAPYDEEVNRLMELKEVKALPEG